MNAVTTPVSTIHVQKLSSVLDYPVQYYLSTAESKIFLNDYLGQKIYIRFLNEIQCIFCGRTSKKSYSQGYCFPCSQSLARCDLCIVKPEKCHYHLATCREPAWGETHCMIPHVVYLANTSGLKVGITRETQIPTRWIDQGATQALPIIRVKTRYQAGLLEIALKKNLNDKTDWRKMLQGNNPSLDLLSEREKIFEQLDVSEYEYECLDKTTVIDLQYPVLQYPQKIQSINLEKTPEVMGTLLGIKGQYLILDVGVLNIRNQTGYKLSFQAV